MNYKNVYTTLSTLSDPYNICKSAEFLTAYYLAFKLLPLPKESDVDKDSFYNTECVPTAQAKISGVNEAITIEVETTLLLTQALWEHRYKLVYPLDASELLDDIKFLDSAKFIDDSYKEIIVNLKTISTSVSDPKFIAFFNLIKELA